jgi:hypothetical protein
MNSDFAGTERPQVRNSSIAHLGSGDVKRLAASFCERDGHPRPPAKGPAGDPPVTPTQVVGVFRQQEVGLPASIGPAARPGVLPGLAHPAGFERIPLHVPATTAQITFNLDARAKARSKWMLCDVYDNVLIPPTVVEHNRTGLDAAVAQLRQALNKTPISWTALTSRERLSSPRGKP